MASDVANERIAVITGAAQGLGAQIASHLAGEGFTVALLDLQAEGLRRTTEKIAGRFDGAVVKAISLDLSSEELVANAFGELDAEFGRVDVLVNTAGGSGSDHVLDIEKLSSQTWHRVLDNNATSTFLCCKYAVPIMRRNGYGRIVNFSSGVSGGVSGPSKTIGARLPYATSKAAINGFTKQLAKDLSREGITVNAISPGLILPEEGRVKTMFDSLADAEKAAIRSMLPAGRTGTATEIASAVAYLVSEAASYTSGAIVSVDGAAS